MNGGNNPTTTVTVAKGDATVSPSTASHTLGTNTTLAIALTLNGRVFTNLLDGATSLVAPTDYTVTNNIYTIKAEYLNAQAPGTNTLTFQMDGGAAPETAVAIAAGNATVSPSSGTYLLGSTNTLTFTVTENGRDFQRINDGTTNLTQTTHFSVTNGNVFTILPAYLNAQPIGPRQLTFVMDGGILPSGTVNVQAGNATVLPASISRDLASTNNATFTLTLNGRALSQLKNGATVLSNPAHYTVTSNNVVTIKASYINTLAAGSTVTFTFDVDGGTDPTGNVVIGTGDPTVSPTHPEYALGSLNDLPITITPRGTTFVALKNGVDALISPTDFVINGNVCTIKAAYLEQQTVDTDVALTVEMSAGVAPTTTVSIVAGNASVSPATASYERGSGTDVGIDLTLNGRTFVDILNGTNVLTGGGTDYDVSDDTYTIMSEYLEVQSGAVSLTFSMDGGTNPVAVINVSLSTDATLTSVLTENDSNPNGGDGSSTGTAIVWDIDVPNSTTTLELTDVAVAPLANFTLTTNANFTADLLEDTNTLALAVGRNDVYIKVIADATNTVKYYQVELWREASDDTTLVSMLGQSTTNTTSGDGTLASPYVAAIDVVYYTNSLVTDQIEVADQASFRLYTTNSYSSFHEKTGTNAMSLTQGVVTPAYVKVIAEDNTTVTYYKVDVSREAGNTNAALTNVLSQELTGIGGNGSLSTPYTSTVSVAYSVTNLAFADIQIEGIDAVAKLYSNTNFNANTNLNIALNYGDNHAYITVVPQDDRLTYYYDVTIDRVGDTTATLTTVLGETPAGAAGSGTVGSPYTRTISVADSVNTLHLTDIVIDGLEAVTNLYSNDTFDAAEDQDLALTQGGATHAYIKATPQDNSISYYYDVTITRLAVSSDATIATVLGEIPAAVGGGDGSTDLLRIVKDIDVPYAVTNLSLTDIVPTHDFATVDLYSAADYTTGDGADIALTQDGVTEAYIKIMAEDTTTPLFYQITINNGAPTTVAGLVSVLGMIESTVTTNGLGTTKDGTNVANRLTWTFDVPFLTNTLKRADITITNDLATFNLYTADDFTAGEITGSTPVALTENATNHVYVKVVAEDTTITNFYEGIIFRELGDTNTALTSVLGQSDPNPLLQSGLTTNTPILWGQKVGGAVLQVAYTNETIGTNDIVIDEPLSSFNLYSDPAFSAQVTDGTIALLPGVPTNIYVKVTPQSGITPAIHYDVKIERLIGDTNAALTSVMGLTDENPILQAGTTNAPILWGQRPGAVLEVAYTNVSIGTNDIVIANTTNSTFNLYTDSGYSDEVETTNTIALLPGVATNLYIKVTPQAAATHTLYYDVRIVRNAGETNAALASVLEETVESPAGAGTFSSPYLWGINVANGVDGISLNDIVVATNTATAQLYTNTFIEASEVTSTNTVVPLLVPTTEVFIKVTAMDPAVQKFYKVTVSRAPSTDTGLTTILGQAAPSFSGAGATAGEASSGALTIPYTTTSVSTNDIVSAAESSFQLFADSNFADPVTGEIEIGMDPVTIYVLVTAEDDTTIRYYQVVLTRAGGLVVSPATLSFTSIPGYNPPTQEITISNGSTNTAIVVTNVTTYSANSTSNAWFSLGTNTFALAAEETVTRTASINVTNLAVGTYTATNTFTDADNIPWQTVVTLDITASADNEIFFSGLTQDYTGSNIAVGVTCRSGATNIVVTYNGSNTIPVNVGSYAVTATVATAGNWIGTTNSATLEIVSATQAITFEGTNAVYDGTAKAVTATALLGTNAVTITYDGSAIAPTNAGSYAVVGTVVAGPSWLAGTNTTTLTIAKAPQAIVNFSLPSSAQMNELIALTAEISPVESPATVTLAVQSGPGSIDAGNNLTFTGGGTVTVRASAAATDNYLAAVSVDATVDVIDFAMDSVTEFFGSAHNGLHTLKFSPEGDLYMFYSATNGAMNVSKQIAGEEAFGTPLQVGTTTGNYLLRSPMDMLFGSTTNIAGQSGTWELLADMTNGTVASFTNTATAGLRNSRFLAGTAPTNYLFVNRGTSISSPRVIAYVTTNDWVTKTATDIGPGVLTGAAREGNTIAVFTSAGALLSANAGTSYSAAGTPAGAMARGGDRAWYAVNLRTVNQATYMDVYSNRKLLSDAGWSNNWNLVSTFETGNDTVSHPRLTAYENIAILTWQQGDTGKLMYTVTQDHGATWTDALPLVSVPNFVRANSLEAGYDVAVHKVDDGVRFVAAAGLNYSSVNLSSLKLYATALQTNVYLRWTQPTSLGAPSDEVLIRYLSGTNMYPTLDLGTTVYNGTEQLAIHSDVIQDQTYFYQLWVRSGASFVDPTAFSGGKEISMFEWNYALPSASVSPATADYTKNSGLPPAFTLTGNGREVSSITSSGIGSPLVLNTDYTVTGNVYTISETYLGNQTAGETITLTFAMDGGDNQSVAVTVFDSATVDQLTPVFEQGTSGDLALTLTLNGRTFQSILNGETTLTENTAYTVSGNTYTILASYLNAQDLGETSLEFVMDGGTNPVSVITIVGGATVSPTTYRHTLGVTNVLSIAMTARGRTMTNLTDAVASLTVTDDYTVTTNNVYSILPAYLNALTDDSTLTFQMSAGVNPQTLIKLSSGDTEVDTVSGTHTLGTTNTVTLTLELNARTFNALTDGTKVLEETTDYTKSVNGDTLTVILLPAYLNLHEPDPLTLEFNMDAGADPTAIVSLQAGQAVLTGAGGTYELGAGAAKAFTVTRNGRSLIAIRRLGTPLSTSDYSVDVTNSLVPVYTISTNYLNTLPVGTNTLTFDMSGGTDLDVQIEAQVGNATVDPAAANYTIGAGSALPITLTLNGRTFVALKNGATPLTNVTHYTVNNTNPLKPVYTVSTNYLNSLTPGNSTLTFDMNDGTDPDAVVTVAAGAPAQISLTGPATVTGVDTDSSNFTITVKDIAGNTVNATQNTTFNLSDNGNGGSPTFNPGDVTSVTINAGSSTVTFNYQNTTLGTYIITATRASGNVVGAKTASITVQ